VDHADRVVPDEGEPPRHKLIERHPDRVEVGARVNRLAEREEAASVLKVV
jgi:hypothetical protein